MSSKSKSSSSSSKRRSASSSNLIINKNSSSDPFNSTTTTAIASGRKNNNHNRITHANSMRKPTSTTNNTSSYMQHTFSSTAVPASSSSSSSVFTSNLRNAAREARRDLQLVSGDKEGPLLNRNTSSLLMSYFTPISAFSVPVSSQAAAAAENEGDSFLLSSLSINSPSSSSLSLKKQLPLPPPPSSSRSNNAMMMNSSSFLSDPQIQHPLLRKIQQDLTELKKKFPVVIVPESTVKDIENQQPTNSSVASSSSSGAATTACLSSRGGSISSKTPSPPNNTRNNTVPIVPAPALDDSDGSNEASNTTETATLMNGRHNNTLLSFSQQLLIERDQHRQKLDQVWRCAQGWRSRSREIESNFKTFAQTLVLEVETERMLQFEEKTRLEIQNLEQKYWLDDIVMPFFAEFTKQQPKNVPRLVAGDSSGPLHSWMASKSKTSSSSSCEATATSTIYRVKDSELLRALKIAEERLAQLGEPSLRMLTVGKNLTTY